jgi:cellulose synthase/poly-beta-1,6-N-acetylglucosamine synthase-like glycosyltransferase
VKILAIPLVVILIDDGDRTVRYLFELRKTILVDDLSLLAIRYSDRLEKFDLKPYRVMLSVYNIQDEWPEIWNRLKPLKNELFIVNDASTDQTQKIIAQDGVKVVSNEGNTNKPGAILFGLSCLPKEVETALVMDPDVEIPDRTILEQAIFDFQRSGAAACALNILPALNKRNYLEMCQFMEYSDAMFFGKAIPHNDVYISGAAAILQRETLEKYLKLSSKSVYGEDMEISILILLSKLRTYFDDRVLIRTKVPFKLKELTKQRMGWFFAMAKVTFSFARKALHHPDLFFKYNFYVYNLIIVILLLPLRFIAICICFISIIALLGGLFIPILVGYQLLPIYFILFITVLYILMTFDTFIWNKELKARDFPVVFLYFFYNIYQVMVPMALGYTNYLCWILTKKKVIGDPYEKTETLL